MWLYRGAQSAVFYYATCTPCAASIDRRKRKRDAANTHREPPPTTTASNNQNDIVTDQPPVIFHQPVPFTTNSYWEEEITLGPGPPVRRAGRRNNTNSSGHQNCKNCKRCKKQKKNLNSPHAVGCQGGNPATAGAGAAQSQSQESPLQNGMGALAGAVSGVLEDLVPSRKELGDRWNRIRYQREDEVLWGGAGSGAGGDLGSEIKGSSVGLSGRGRAGTSDSAKYYAARNPAVNDLHPPVVCGPVSRAETRWMLQPPPSAKVMEGKVRSTASVSVRNGRQRSFERDVVSGRDGNGNGNGEEGARGRTSASPQMSQIKQQRQRQRQRQRQADGQLDGCDSAHLQARTEQLSLETPLRKIKTQDEPPAIRAMSDNFLSLSLSSKDDALLRSPRPVLAPLTGSPRQPSVHPDHHDNYHPYHQNDNVNTLTLKPQSTPPVSWQWPQQRAEDPQLQSRSQSRPTSKATTDSGKSFTIQQKQQQQQQRNRQCQHQRQPDKLHTAWPSSTLDIAMKHHDLVRSVRLELSSPETAYFYDIGDDDDDDGDYGGHYDGRISDGEKQPGKRYDVRPWRWSMDI
ncbi:conserved hypothetical protein [Histoplasma capsulatum var. duboisii H88]|uniref:Uncharacterized protein n=1 Tax=Ajellomyces capsulatus (strain H88) TaxID=544711 RepID=F0UCY9_AJEC8|nr:conserved hypothetical protein [Histoplasma capsulatum var. duboisii H88]QSS49596.1 hypothetical protein I7I53_09996 [Histoplasma capsulatum var. duboisii H88]